MQYSLAALVRQKTNPRRSSIDLRPLQPTQALASDLYVAVYRKIVDRLTGTLPALVEAYDKSPPVHDAALVRDAASDMQSTLEAFAASLRQLVDGLVPGITTWAQRVARWHDEKWKASVLAGAGVDVSTILMASGKPQSVADTIAWNVRLVKDVSDQAQARISQEVFAAFQTGKSSRDLAKDLREIVDMSRRRSLGIASDQLGKLSAALDRERATQAGLKRYTWRHSAKRHPRPVHVARNGQVFAYDDPLADGPPGTQPYCGCRAQAKIEFD